MLTASALRVSANSRARFVTSSSTFGPNGGRPGAGSGAGSEPVISGASPTPSA